MIKEPLLTCTWKWEANLTFRYLGNSITKKKGEMRLFRLREALDLKLPLLCNKLLKVSQPL